MHDLFNPAGLHVLEDRDGAVAYGWIAERVLYGRFVGTVSAELGTSFVQRLAGLIGEVPCLAYYADHSALEQYDRVARECFQNLVLAQRSRFASLTLLTWSGGGSARARAFAALLPKKMELLTDPLEFDELLSDVAGLPMCAPLPMEPVWHVHSLR